MSRCVFHKDPSGWEDGQNGDSLEAVTQVRCVKYQTNLRRGQIQDLS